MSKDDNPIYINNDDSLIYLSKGDNLTFGLQKEIPLSFRRSDGETLSFTVDPVELGKLLQWAYEHRETLYAMLNDFEIHQFDE